MKLTNQHKLPDSIVSAITEISSNYSRGKADCSVTQLIDSPKIKILSEEYHDKITEDVADRIWSVLGTSVHDLIEKTDNKAITEKRLFAECNGWVISGALDRIVILDGK